MTKFGKVPPEPAKQDNLAQCAPGFSAKVYRVLETMRASGLDPIVYEAIRSNERQSWLYGMGRAYDDGRGPVTRVKTAIYGMHFYGLAVDIISHGQEWDAPGEFWAGLVSAATSEGLVPGALWKRRDLPHIQWPDVAGLIVDFTPTEEMINLYQKEGVSSVWTAVGAG